MSKRKTNFRHKITFQSLDPESPENKAVIMAFCGGHTRAIGKATGLSAHAAQYRIMKGLGKGARKKFRDGESKYYAVAMAAIAPLVMKEHIIKKVAPKFVPPSLPT